MQLIAAGADVDAKDKVRTLHLLYVWGDGARVGESINYACSLRRMVSLQWN